MGVGHGEDEDPGPKVRSACIASSDPQGTGSVSSGFEPFADLREPLGLAAGDVLDDDGGGPEVLDGVEVGVPEAGSFALEAFAVAGGADVLAGESSRQYVGSPKSSSCEKADIIVELHAGEVSSQDGTAPGVEFAHPGVLEAGPLEA